MTLLTLWLRLRTIGRRAAPDRSFVVALGERFKEPKSTAFFFLSWRRVTVTSAVVVGLLGSTATYAYASPQILPDHFLYPVRLALEQVETTVAFSPVAKERVQFKHLERRIAETRAVAPRASGAALARQATALSSGLQSLQMQEPVSDQEEYLRETVSLDQQEFAEVTAVFDEDVEDLELASWVQKQTSQLEAHAKDWKKSREQHQKKEVMPDEESGE